MKTYKNGFIKTWIISGVKEEDIPDIPLLSDPKDMSLAARTMLIKEAIIDDYTYVANEPQIGENSLLGMPWEYYQAGENTFVDRSRFYHLMQKCEMHAACEIWSEADKTVSARMWHFPSMHVFLNGELVYAGKHLKQYPIKYGDFELKLNKGKNLLFVRSQYLGVINANNMFAVKLLDTEGITVEYPGDKKLYADYFKADNWLYSLIKVGNTIKAVSEPPFPVRIVYDTSALDWRQLEWDKEYAKDDIKKLAWEKGSEFVIEDKCVHCALSIKLGETELVRKIEFNENLAPNSTSGKNFDKEEYFRKIAMLGETMPVVNHSIYYLFAAYSYGIKLKNEDEIIDYSLDYINNRGDCADFTMSGLLRFYRAFSDKLDDDVKKRIEDAIINFRYWADEKGMDGMAMGTENHSLMFHACQIAAGKLFADRRFTQSGRLGLEQYEVGIERCKNWLSEIERKDIDETNSGAYMPITQGALITVIDFAEDEEIEARATKVLDGIYKKFAIHTFDNVAIAPQGRMYRPGIYPFLGGGQAMVYYMDPDCKGAVCEHTAWQAGLIDTKYIIPDYRDIMYNPLELSYVSGGGKFNVKKTKDYIITSTDVPTPVKERDDIVPGHLAGQRHLCFAGLSNRCVTFVNHPGADNDLSLLRPGYWYGNGVFPRMSQQGSSIFVEYNIPDTYPIQFTHAYFPVEFFDETVVEDNYLFGRKNDGYVAISCSSKLEPHNEVLFNCDFRAYAADVKWVITASSKKESGSFDEFIKEIKAK